MNWWRDSQIHRNGLAGLQNPPAQHRRSAPTPTSGFSELRLSGSCSFTIYSTTAMPVAPDYCLAVNCGSSSIKFKLYQAKSHRVVLAGSASNVQGSSPAKFTFKHVPKQEQDSTELSEKVKRELDSSTSYQDVFEEILRDVTSDKVLGEGGKDRIQVIAHRIVHGGTARDPVVIKHGDESEQETLKRMDEVSDFAPLHVSWGATDTWHSSINLD